MPPLTDAKIRTLPVPAAGRKKYADGRGLCLLVAFTGKKVWYLRRRVDGKEQMVRLGAYPDMGLADAHKAAEAARGRLARGLPAKEVLAPVVTFADVTREWLELQRATKSPGYVKDIGERLARHVLPALGERPVAELRPGEVLDVLQGVAAQGIRETTRRLRRYVSAICRLAVIKGYADIDPAASLAEALPPPVATHMPARTSPEEVRALFAACAAYWGNRTIRNALLLLALTAARPGMISGARWEEFDPAGAAWTLPPERMKMRRRFAVPLSAPALEILDEQAGISGGGVFVFPGRDRTRGLSNGALNAALRTMGVHDHVAHGWRSSFSTLAHEAGHFRGEVIEKALAHEQKNRVAAAYDRSELWPERVALMDWWGEFLLEGLLNSKENQLL
ncbi:MULTISPECIES: integrase arm-type DNA-binding domain-containing protein [unclassified Desulfovibrio]|uniref:tyrosine-type recombinase/integrase n=1 Tax=unclassified Desulfovibrio TaxID=2593640 RepID=UPI0013EA6DF6|nr:MULTISPECIES: integrase arm-type DNA-binding domain-containing protein [unclassified Desulfovibrio]